MHLLHETDLLTWSAFSIGPMLLGLLPGNSDGNDEKRQSVAPDAADAWKDLPPHKDEAQVRLDVDRSFIYYPNGMRRPSSLALRHAKAMAGDGDESY